MRLSPSVDGLHEQFAGAAVNATQLVAALLRTHAYVPGELAARLPSDGGDELPVEQWIERAHDVFDAEPGTVLHGRLFIVALALLDTVAGGQLARTGALHELIAGLRDAPPLRAEFVGRWEMLLGNAPYPPSVGPPAQTPATEPAAASAGAADAQRRQSLRSADERVATHADDPAVVDQLGRRPFATVIADRIREVWAGRAARADERGGSFMVHVHGPWGSGKSSVLNFLAADLRDHARASRAAEPIVVEFNAWRHQRLRPPWWTLIREIHGQSARSLARTDRLAALRLRLRWRLWRAQLDWLPVLVAGLLLVLGVPLAWLAARAIGTEVDAEVPLNLLAALLTIGAAAFALSRSLVFGSARAAQTYADLRSDPLDPIVKLFGRLATALGRPLVVFIDDLDRCDAGYVVELLEGIQTLFRSAPVTYVVAADRKWICSSFETCYEGFGATIGEPGRPLGYLFLDKMFQISAGVPQPPPRLQRDYWEALLCGGTSPAELEAQVRAREPAALRELAGVHTQADLERRIEQARDAADPAAEHAMRAAAARRITSPEAQRAAEHRLRGFAPLLEPNPRAMTRLVNAFGLHQATHLLEGRSVPPETLARWTIVELRWPLLADHLTQHPQTLALLSAPDGAAHASEVLRPLLEDEQVRRVIHGDGDGGVALTEATIREIVGRSAESRAEEARAEDRGIAVPA